MSSHNLDIMLLSTADWDNPFWTNKQHVAVELSKLGHRILYVESIGLRSPSLNRSDISRIFKRLIKGLRLPQKVAENIWVWSPLVLPFQKYRLVRYFNKVLLAFFSRAFTFFLGFKNPLIWTYNPMTLNILNIGHKATLVYHCVDEIKQQPGMPAAAIEFAENALLQRADYVFVTSDELYRTRKQVNSNTHLFSNVADYDHFSKANDSATPIPQDILHAKKPIIGFVGAISAYKLDFALIAFIAKNKPDWSFVLIGKVGEGEPGTDITELDFPNVHLLGPREYKDLPAYIKGFDVAIIPVSLNEYTHAMFPMKFFEYMAAGKRIVSTAIDSLHEFSDYAYLANSYDDFIVGIEDALTDKEAGLEERLQLASSKTYKKRTIEMLKIIKKNNYSSFHG